MNLSRKDFFRKGLYSLVETLGTVAGATKPSTPAEFVEQEEQEFVPSRRDDLLAVADNGQCLAGSCGCFSCEERCEYEAVTVVMGEGIRIDAERCTGCGACEHVCPVTPKAVRLQPRTNERISSADDAETKKKGESTC